MFTFCSVNSVALSRVKAVGKYEVGNAVKGDVTLALRHLAEHCGTLQTMNLYSATSGGVGSGLGNTQRKHFLRFKANKADGITKFRI